MNNRIKGMKIEVNSTYHTHGDHGDSYAVMATKVKKCSSKFTGVIVEHNSPGMVGRTGLFYKNGFK
jgi:hypothetical protein